MKRIISILLYVSILIAIGCKSKLDISDAFTFTLTDDILYHDYLYFFSDDRKQLEKIDNDFIASKDKSAFIDTFYLRSRTNNNYLSRQTIRYERKDATQFSIIRDGVHGFENSIKIENDSILFTPDPANCPELMPCSFKSSVNWCQGERKGIFCFDGFKTIRIGKKTFKKCVVLKMDTEHEGFVRFWIAPKIGIIKTYSETPTVFTVQYLSKIILTEDEYKKIENPMLL